MERGVYKVKNHEGETMKTAVIGTTYQIEPVSGIDEVIFNLSNVFSFKKAKAIACTYSYTPDVIGKLKDIFAVLRVFAGKGHDGMLRGAYMTHAQLHFKCIFGWDNRITVAYIGSSNLSNETGGNYGLLIMKDGTTDGFDTSINTKKYEEWHDPVEVIMSEIITRETGGRCEECGSPANILYLNNYAKLVCERCK